jgi:NitT/TauT family transport system permease protein
VKAVVTQQTAIAAPARRVPLGWPVLRSRRQRLALGRVLLFGVLLAVWQFGTPLLRVPSFLLPTPTAIGAALVKGLLVSPLVPDGFYYHAAVTLAEGFAGCLLGGVVGLFLGTALAYSPLLERVTLPYIMGFQSVPKVAVAPLIIIWFGIGMSSKIVLVTLLAFFPLLINSLLGFKSVEPERLELLASLRASRWQVFRLVMVRSALPAILAGVEMAILFSLTGSIVGEFLAGQAGLGVLIQRTKSSFNLAGTFAVLITLALIGVLLVVLVRLMRRKLVFWAAADRRLDTNL